jgi:hypothetical protein
LDLGYNRLGGTLPAEYGKNNFRFLYLDHNQFVNSIPSEYGQMGNWKLQELWLNNNTLTGTSPSAFNPIWIRKFTWRELCLIAHYPLFCQFQ